MPVEFWSNLICLWPWMCLAFWSAQTGSNDTGFAWVGASWTCSIPQTPDCCRQTTHRSQSSWSMHLPSASRRCGWCSQWSVPSMVQGQMLYIILIYYCLLNDASFDFLMIRQSQTARPRHFRGEIMNQHIQCFRPKHKFDFIMTIIVSLRYVPRATN